VLGSNLNCTFIDVPFIIDQSVFIAKFNDEQTKSFEPKFVLAQLTSKLVSYYFKHKANEFDNLFPKIKIGEFKDLPIKICPSNDQIFLSEKANEMLLLCEKMRTFNKKFLDYITSQYEIQKLNSNLLKYYESQFPDFIKELNKAIKASKGVPLTKKDEFEWMELFEENKKKVVDLKTHIDQTDREIDRMVYALYGLTEEEIAIVEGS
jgi:hypothetical protein